MRPRPETLEALRAYVADTWKGNPPGAAADRILARAAEWAHGGAFPLGRLGELAGCESMADEVMGAAVILCQSPAAVFGSAAELIEGDTRIPLPRDAISKCLEQGWLAHPVTGERLGEGWEARVIPMVEPNDYIKGLVPAPSAEPGPG